VTQQINQAYAGSVASQFQGFARNFHNDGVTRLKLSLVARSLDEVMRSQPHSLADSSSRPPETIDDEHREAPIPPDFESAAMLRFSTVPEMVAGESVEDRGPLGDHSLHVRKRRVRWGTCDSPILRLHAF